MGSSLRPSTGVLASAWSYWNEHRAERGFRQATGSLFEALWEFARDSTPERLRSRFGDAEYDWDHRVNTTSGAVGWRDRLLGEFHSAYQPTDQGFFSEMMDGLRHHTRSNLQELTFIDLGSGKGRVLLMASDYPFRKIIGVELLPSLNRIAQENIAKYKSEAQKCFALESTCADATNFPLPDGPVVLYLFNPFPEAGLSSALENLRQSLHNHQRPVYVLYHNPQLEHVFTEEGHFKKIAGTLALNLNSEQPLNLNPRGYADSAPRSGQA